MNHLDIQKQLKAIAKWSGNLLNSLEGIDPEIDQEEKEALLSISKVILKKAAIVHRSLGGQEPQSLSTPTSTQDQTTITKLQNEAERLTAFNASLIDAQKQSQAEISRLKSVVHDLETQRESVSSNEPEAEKIKELEQKSEDFRERVIKLEETLQESDLKYSEVLMERDCKEAEITELRTVVRVYKNEVESMKAQFEQRLRIFAEKEEELASLKATIQEIKSGNPEA